MVIDFHTHVFPDAMAAKVVEQLKSKTREKVRPAGDGTMQQLMDQMNAAGIDKSAICPIATKPDQFESILKFSLAVQSGKIGQREQRMLIPLASVHPAHPECFQQLRRVAESGIRGVKIHPYYQNFSLRSDHTIDLLRCCRDLGLVVVCHCGLDIGFPPAQICTPGDVADIHAKIEGIRFIAAHLGGWRMWNEVLKELVGKPVYLDTSVLEHDLRTKEVQEILHRHPAERLLMASDWPWCPLEKAAGLIRGLNRTMEEKEMILGGNAQKLLSTER